MVEGLRTHEVAELLGVSTRTVQNYVEKGKLTPKKDARGRNRFDRKEVGRLRESFLQDEEEEKRNELPFHAYNPESQIVLDRKAYEDHMQRHEGLLVKLGQLEAENRLVRKQLEDMSTRKAPEPIEAHHVEPIHEDPPAAPPPQEPKGVQAVPEPIPEAPQQHPSQASQDALQQQQDTWRKFVHGPAQIGPIDDPRPFWTAPVVEVRKPWWKRLLGK